MGGQPGFITEVSFVKIGSIASGVAASSVFDIRHGKAFALELPAAFDGTSITFQVADEEDGTFQTVYDTSDAAVSITVQAGRTYALHGEALAIALAAARFLKIVSGTNQTGATSGIKLYGVY